jgi:hypothetical protein
MQKHVIFILKQKMEIGKRLEEGENWVSEFFSCDWQIHVIQISHSPYMLDNGVTVFSFGTSFGKFETTASYVDSEGF